MGSHLYLDTNKEIYTLYKFSDNDEKEILINDLEDFMENVYIEGYDLIGFLNSEEYVQWFENSGIKEDIDEGDYEHLMFEYGYYDWEDDILKDLYELLKEVNIPKVKVVFESVLY